MPHFLLNLDAFMLFSVTSPVQACMSRDWMCLVALPTPLNKRDMCAWRAEQVLSIIFDRPSRALWKICIDVSWRQLAFPEDGNDSETQLWTHSSNILLRTWKRPQVMKFHSSFIYSLIRLVVCMRVCFYSSWRLHFCAWHLLNCFSTVFLLFCVCTS